MADELTPFAFFGADPIGTKVSLCVRRDARYFTRNGRRCDTYVTMTRHAGRDHPDFDWRERAHYEYTNRISDRGWAWEGLRRNREFRQAWQEARPGFDCEDLGNGVTVVKARESANGLGDWGILYSDSPHIDARNAAIVWQSPCMQVLKAVALPERSHRGWGSIRLIDIRCSTLVVIAPDGRQHILFHGHGGSLQLAVAGASVLESVHLLTDAIPDTADVKSHLQVQTLLDQNRQNAQTYPISYRGAPKLERRRISSSAASALLSPARTRYLSSIFERNCIEMKVH